MKKEGTVLERYERKKQAKVSTIKKKAFRFIPGLLRQGLKTLIIKFDGEGDNGMVGDIYCTTQAAENFDSCRIYNKGESAGVLSDAARAAFEEYAYEILPSGFGNDGGSYGIAKLDLTTRKTEIEITWRDVRYETETLHK
jgi:hypothetical protein